MTDSEMRTAAAFAAALLETDGWCQGRLGGRGDGSPSCLVGALAPFTPGPSVDDPVEAYEVAVLVVPESWRAGLTPSPNRWLVPQRWNDEAGRTAGEVVGALRRFADGSPPT